MRNDNIIARTGSRVNGLISRGIKTTLDVITSISQNGKRLNAKTLDGAEIRDVRIITPYGISSSGLDGIMIQIIVNDGNSANAVGVYDQNKPDVLPGEVIIYNKTGATIKMLTDGEIVLTNRNNKSVTVTEIYNHLHP